MLSIRGLNSTGELPTFASTNPRNAVKHHLFLTVLLLFVVFASAGQVSFSVNFGTVVAAEDDDPYSLKNTWVPISGNSSQTESMRFYSKGTGTLIKFTGMWEVSEIFSAGLTYRMVKWNMEEAHRTSDINSLGGLFRVNFTRNTKKVIPFFQGTFYFSNNNTMKQDQATQGSQTQPAFTLTASTSIGFDIDLGIEFKVGKAWGLQATAGYGGVQATNPDLTVNFNYGSYYGPKYIDGVFNYAFSVGAKYYTGRSAKQRDF
jgi:hypothetical protein